MFPESMTVSISAPINAFVDWLVVTYGDAFQAFADGLLILLVGLESFLRDAPWWFVLILIGLIAYGAGRRWVLSLALVAL